MPTRPWTLAVARLKTRSADAREVPAKLRAVLDDALSTCDALLLHLGEAELEVERLKHRATEQAAEYEQLFHEMPVACVVVDGAGRILHANAQAATLLNVSARRLPERLLMHFVDEREAFQKLLDGLAPTGSTRSTLMVRPRERARIEATVHMVPLERGSETVGLCFLLPRQRSTSRGVTERRPPIVATPLPPSVSADPGTS
jgi:PAS domain-containing protein